MLKKPHNVLLFSLAVVDMLTGEIIWILNFFVVWYKFSGRQIPLMFS